MSGSWLTPEILMQRIQLLDEIQFVRLGNTLLARLAARNGIAPSHLALNEQTKDPDGGIDARCEGAPRTVGRLIPRSDVAYQFKAGSQKKSARAIAAEDIQAKPRVLAALQSGSSFVYIAGWDRSDQFGESIAKEARKLGVSVEKGQIFFIGPGTITHLLAGEPALIEALLGVGLDLIPFERWSRIERLDNPFRTDGALENRLVDLRVRMSQPGAVTRVTGAPGDGKTRTVLEALRGSGFEGTVLYALQRTDLHASFVSYLRQTPGVECTVVVDEVDDADADRLRDAFTGMPPNVRLVTIGSDAGAARIDALRLPAASVRLLAEIVGAIVPGLSDETRSRVAHACEGSPKLAVLIARRIQQEPDLVAPHRYLMDREVQDELGRLLGVTETDPGWRALSCIALLERIGWLEEAESESIQLFEAAGLGPDDAREQVHRLDRRYGIAPLAGRFRYISPQILGDHLALHQLESWRGDRVRRFVAALTPAMADSFARRLRRTGAALPNRSIIERAIFGEHGPFRSLSDLEESRGASLLRHIGGAFPGAALEALDRTIGDASDSELVEAKQSRRDLVVALSELLWRRDSFARAAELLLRLACNENEDWANNATGTWAETFQTMLGRTEAGAAARAAVLRRAARSDDPRTRQLSARALGVAVKIGHVSRMGMPPRELEGMPEEAWQPATYHEWFDAILLYLDILELLLRDSEPAVQQAAADALAEGTQAAFQFPPVTDAWIAAALTLKEAPYAQRATVARAVDRGLARWERDGKENDEETEPVTPLKPEDRERLGRLKSLRDELLGPDFSTRLRWALTQDPWMGGGSWEEVQERITREVTALATEIKAVPERLQDELDWLRAQPFGVAERLFEALGRVDKDRVLFPVIDNSLNREPREIGWRSMYDASYADAHGGDAFLNTRLAELEHQDEGGMQAFDFLLRCNPSADRVRHLITLFESGAIPPFRIEQLIYGPWRRMLSPADVILLGQAALTTGEGGGIRAAVSLLHFHLRDHPEQGDTLREIAVALLVYRSKEPQEGGGRDDWAALAQMYIDDEPVRLVRAALQRAATREDDDQDLRRLIRRAWDRSDKSRVFVDAIAPWLGTRSLESWGVRKTLHHFPLEEIGLERLAEWIAEDPDVRAEAIAEIAGAPWVPVSDLHAMLLEHFGEYGVGDALFGAHISGVFTGSAVAWERGKLAEAKRWAEDNRPAVREWAEGVVRSLEATLHQSEQREAEERFRW